MNIKLTIAVCLLALSACSTTPTEPNGSWLSPDQQLANGNIEQWKIGGKINLRTKQDSNTGYLNWRQCHDQFEIRLTGPLGQGAAKLYGNKDQVTLKTKDHTQTATSPEELIAQQGWQLPVSQLTYWVRGIPSPHFKTNNKTSNGFEQMGWLVKFSQWQNIHNHRLPKKATATHPELKVTLLLKNWSLTNSCDFAELPTQQKPL